MGVAADDGRGVRPARRPPSCACRRGPAAGFTPPCLFEELCRRTSARGNAVPDAYLAALAIEHGCVWYSADRGFTRYRGLRYQHPLDAGGEAHPTSGALEQQVAVVLIEGVLRDQ